MPSAEHAAIALFGAQILGGVAAGIFIAQWLYHRTKRIREGNVTSFPMKFPGLVMLLLLLSVCCGIAGLWLLHRLPKPAPCPAPIASSAIPRPITTDNPSVRKRPPSSRKPAAHLDDSKVSQGGAGNQKTVIEGSVTQSGGDCTQNVVGGNGNTNNCTPPIRVTTSFDVPQPAPSEDGHPRASFRFYTDKTWIEGKFAIICDHECHLTPQMCGLPGMNPGTEWGLVNDTVPAIDFHRDFPSATYCLLTVESNDNEPVKVTAVKTLTLTNQKPK
jgi:hypothetical protein